MNANKDKDKGWGKCLVSEAVPKWESENVNNLSYIYFSNRSQVLCLPRIGTCAGNLPCSGARTSSSKGKPDADLQEVFPPWCPHCYCAVVVPHNVERPGSV